MLVLAFTLAIFAPELSDPLRARRDDGTSTPLPTNGAAPLEAIDTTPPQGPVLPTNGAAPLAAPVREVGVPVDERARVARPFGPGARPSRAPDPRTLAIVRMDITTGPLFRRPAVDTFFATGVEYGRTHGFSAALHTGIIIASDRGLVRALDFPIGVGAIARGRLRRRPLFASVGLTAGLLIHRADTERGVIRRVDPDLRLPIRFAWTIATLGLSVALEQGYSVRSRSYSRRGAEVWARHAYRVGFVVGLHYDLRVPAAKVGTGSRRRRR